MWTGPQPLSPSPFLSPAGVGKSTQGWRREDREVMCRPSGRVMRDTLLQVPLGTSGERPSSVHDPGAQSWPLPVPPCWLPGETGSWVGELGVGSAPEGETLAVGPGSQLKTEFHVTWTTWVSGSSSVKGVSLSTPYLARQPEVRTIGAEVL